MIETSIWSDAFDEVETTRDKTFEKPQGVDIWKCYVHFFHFLRQILNEKSNFLFGGWNPVYDRYVFFIPAQKLVLSEDQPQTEKLIQIIQKGASKLIEQKWISHEWEMNLRIDVEADFQADSQACNYMAFASILESSKTVSLSTKLKTKLTPDDTTAAYESPTTNEEMESKQWKKLTNLNFKTYKTARKVYSFYLTKPFKFTNESDGDQNKPFSIYYRVSLREVVHGKKKGKLVVSIEFERPEFQKLKNVDPQDFNRQARQGLDELYEFSSQVIDSGLSLLQRTPEDSKETLQHPDTKYLPGPSRTTLDSEWNKILLDKFLNTPS